MKTLALFFIIFPVNFLISGINGNAKTVSCNESDREALLDFKIGLQDSTNRISTWQGKDCCNWWGIFCNKISGSVVRVDFHNPYPSNSDSSGKLGFWNLSGEIRPSLAKLKSLRYLDLSFNTFNGKIPEFISSLSNLQYLNLSNAGFRGEITPSLGNLSNLKVLDVSSNFPVLTVQSLEWVSGLISVRHIEMTGSNLSKAGSGWVEPFNRLSGLTELHLSGCGLTSVASSVPSVNFSSLAVLDLMGNNLNSVFPDWLVNISTLEWVDLSSCRLFGRIPLGFGEFPNLKLLNFGQNDNLTASLNRLFQGSWRSIEVLDFSLNKLHGRLPASIRNMTLLKKLDPFSNSVKGGIPGSIGRLCNLEYLDLSGNNLTGSLPQFLQGTENCPFKSPFPSLQYLIASDNRLTGQLPGWLGQLKNLVQLNLQWNFLEGPIPDSFGNLSSLVELRLEANKLNGTLPVSLGMLSQLTVLDVSINGLSGFVSESHFAKLNNLQYLLLSANSFVLNVSSNWNPEFQLLYLELGSCRIGPSFPEWLRFQKQINYVHFPNASLSGFIPEWFWDMSGNLSVLNVSLNRLEGELPNPLKIAPFALVDLSFNLFNGLIPLPMSTINLFDLSQNNFSGLIPVNIGNIMPDLVFLSLSNNQLTSEIPYSIGEMTSLQVIDLSSNFLTGTVPSSIGNCTLLSVLDLQKNNLSGEIPESLGQLNILQTLHLSNNRFSGEILSILQNLSSLETIELSSNTFTGTFPPWMGNSFPNLRIISFRSNTFSGEIPAALSNLISLQVLDLSGNNFTGKIPASFGNLKSMARKQTVNTNLFYGSYMTQYYKENLLVCISGQPQVYTKTLALVTSIDLSENALHGGIPEEIMKLTGLLVLNLSRNHISGEIPEKISKLRELISLDLSNNSLSGSVPPSMSSMTFLAYLNVSNNNLSGSVPYTNQMATFGESSFFGNPGLCGDPLSVKCGNESDGSGGGEIRDESETGDRWIYLSIGVGFAAGLLVPYSVFVFRRSWAGIYFGYVDKMVLKLSCVLTVWYTRHPQTHVEFGVESR